MCPCALLHSYERVFARPVFEISSLGCMARIPAALPPPFDAHPFTTAAALTAGISADRLRRRDVVGLRHGVWVWRPRHSATLTELDGIMPVVRETKGAWISHFTAASMLDIEVPGRRSVRLHVSRPRGVRAVQRSDVVGHQRNVAADELMQLSGVTISTPARIWIELAQYLSLDDLIILGDRLVRIPRGGLEGRTEPWTTPERLRELVERHRFTRGRRKLRIALTLIRIGADSGPETKLRLAFLRAGLPEPQLQVALHPNNPFSVTADLGYRHRKLAVQYDGATHYTPEARARDNESDRAFEREGWRVIRVNRYDLASGFHELIEQVRRILAAP